MRTRILVGVPGVLAGVYGLVLLLGQGLDNLKATVIWLVGGVVVHDGILASVVLVVCALAGRLLPVRLRGPAAAGLVVLGTVTVVAIPVLGRFGARADNATLLDRPYLAGWLVVAGLTLAGVLVMTVLGARRHPTRKNKTTRTGGGSGQGSRG